MNDTESLTPNMTDLSAEELWSSVFGSGFECWEWWRKVRFLDGADWDKPGRVRLTVENPDDEGNITREIGMPELVAAWNRAVVECATLGTGQTLDAEDLDASDGDCILQIAVLGKTVYG